MTTNDRMAGPRDGGDEPTPPSTPWRVIAGPCPLSGKGMGSMLAALRRGEETGVVFTLPTSDTTLDPCAVALEISEALHADERVLLANGPWEQESTLGDPYVARAVALLPSDLPSGIVVGGFHHAHALTELALRSPAVGTYVGPPVAESLGAGDGADYARAAFRLMELLGSADERLLQTPSQSHVGYSRPASPGRSAALPDRRSTTPRTLRAGAAQGRVLAGSLLPLSFAIGRWSEALDGAVLAVEVTGSQLRMIDRYFQRLALLGVFDRIGALLVGVPFDLVPETPSLRLDEVIGRAVGRSSCAVVADAFVGCGIPGTYLRLTAPVTVSARAEGPTITPIAERSPTTPVRR